MTGKFFLPTNAFIGFDEFAREVERLASGAKDTYPPHNVVKVNSGNKEQMLVELAVAGFQKEDLTIELKHNVLTVTGERKDSHDKDTYIYKGISTRKFTKSFRLSEYTEVIGASIEHGILKLVLEVRIPEERLPKRIVIG